MDAMIGALAHACPTCGAQKGQPCRRVIAYLEGGLPVEHKRGEGPTLAKAHLSRRCRAAAA